MSSKREIREAVAQIRDQVEETHGPTTADFAVQKLIVAVPFKKGEGPSKSDILDFLARTGEADREDLKHLKQGKVGVLLKADDIASDYYAGEGDLALLFDKDNYYHLSRVQYWRPDELDFRGAFALDSHAEGHPVDEVAEQIIAAYIYGDEGDSPYISIRRNPSYREKLAKVQLERDMDVHSGASKIQRDKVTNLVRLASNPRKRRPKRNPACALPTGSMTARSRNKLPAKAFGLPSQRKYPLYKMVGSKAVPSKSHATSAKARARTQFERGDLTANQYAAIVGKADKVIRSCSRGSKSNPGSLRNTPGNIADVKHFARSRGVDVKYDTRRGRWRVHSPRSHSVSIETTDPGEAFLAIQGFTSNKNPKGKKTKSNPTLRAKAKRAWSRAKAAWDEGYQDKPAAKPKPKTPWKGQKPRVVAWNSGEAKEFLATSNHGVYLGGERKYPWGGPYTKLKKAFGLGMIDWKASDLKVFEEEASNQEFSGFGRTADGYDLKWSDGLIASIYYSFGYSDGIDDADNIDLSGHWVVGARSKAEAVKAKNRLAFTFASKPKSPKKSAIKKKKAPAGKKRKGAAKKAKKGLKKGKKPLKRKTRKKSR